jgi:hypothetical protein
LINAGTIVRQRGTNFISVNVGMGKDHTSSLVGKVAFATKGKEKEVRQHPARSNGNGLTHYPFARWPSTVAMAKRKSGLRAGIFSRQTSPYCGTVARSGRVRGLTYDEACAAREPVHCDATRP